jgi:hypothetical protein
MKMRSWPFSAFIVILVLALTSGTLLFWLYEHTKESYRAVGFNDGQIHQRELLAKKVEEQVKLKDCKEYGTKPSPTEFLSVKNDSIYMVKVSETSLEFCRWKS